MGDNRKKLKRYKGKNVSPTSGPIQMGQYAIRKIKDIAFGNFNFEQDAHNFQNKEFLMAAIHEVETKVIEQQVYNTALAYAYGASTDGTAFWERKYIVITGAYRRAWAECCIRRTR